MKTDPSKVTVGKYDWVVSNDGIARVSDDYDFDLSKKEIWNIITKGKPKDWGRLIAQPILGGGRTFIQQMEVPMSEIEK